MKNWGAISFAPLNKFEINQKEYIAKYTRNGNWIKLSNIPSFVFQTNKIADAISEMNSKEIKYEGNQTQTFPEDNSYKNTLLNLKLQGCKSDISYCQFILGTVLLTCR